jgi:hypothetical protein
MEGKLLEFNSFTAKNGKTKYRFGFTGGLSCTLGIGEINWKLFKIKGNATRVAKPMDDLIGLYFNIEFHPIGAKIGTNPDGTDSLCTAENTMVKTFTAFTSPNAMKMLALEKGAVVVLERSAPKIIGNGGTDNGGTNDDNIADEKFIKNAVAKITAVKDDSVKLEAALQSVKDEIEAENISEDVETALAAQLKDADIEYGEMVTA